MSISLDAIYHSASWAIYSHSKTLMDLQEKAATGQDINRTSDDPISANQVLDLKTQDRSMDVYLASLNESISIIEFSGSIVQSLSTEIASSMQSLTSVLTGIISTDTRKQLADDIDSRLEQIVDLANTQRLGRRLFAGENTDVDPYAVERNSDGKITNVSYQGGDENREIRVAEGVEVTTTFVGKDLFRADERGDPVFQGLSGIKKGSGTSSIRGDIWLNVTRTGATTMDISLNDQTSVSIDTATVPDPTNVAVVKEDTGEVIYMDVSDVATTMSTGQSVQERVRFRGTYDMFNVLINIRDMLQNEEKMDDDDWNSIMEDMTMDLREVEEKLGRVFPEVGGKVNTLNRFKDSMEDIQLNTSSEISRLQDADIAEVSVDLARTEVLYEMSLNVAAKMFRLSLLDFIG